MYVFQFPSPVTFKMPYGSIISIIEQLINIFETRYKSYKWDIENRKDNKCQDFIRMNAL
jgi:hypothetical protein